VVERARAIVFAGVRSGPEVRVDDSVSHLEVAADMDRLVQVLVNLLQNAYDAIRAHSGTTIEVNAALEGQHVIIRVVDDGPGLPESMQGRLFEPFATTKPPGEGTGLGLYTSYMLVTAMGGRLELEARESGGTEAILRLAAGGGA
jgi:C4-dicarboxylate-specific signal transduction histidine kinase